MINDLIDYFRDKKILILGFGREGKSTYRLIRKYLPNQVVYISDKNENFQEAYNFNNDSNLFFISGKNYLQDLNDFDIIMKSPGISFVNIDISRFYNKIKSQLELLLEFFSNFTIGITGTKGKSTTSSLIYKILKDQNEKCLLMGNIGEPVFDYIDQIDDDVKIVLEMSSHQLEYMELSPNIAVLLNIFPEHLDHYKSFEDYAKAKCNIFKYQNKNDFFLYNSDIELIDNLIDKANGNTYKVNINKCDADIFLDKDLIYFKNEPLYNKKQQRKLPGDYNLNNIMFALGVSKILGLDINKTTQTINNFEPLSHRLEFVGIFKGVKYYDNSIGTVPVATIEAVKALGDVDTLIIGGMDRGIDYTDFIEFLNNSEINNIICMPTTGHIIAKGLKKEKCYCVDNLEEAVNIARRNTKIGMSCLLSPTAASYEYFKNFEEKGDLFKKLVQQI